jgi:hypothetical protein
MRTHHMQIQHLYRSVGLAFAAAILAIPAAAWATGTLAISAVTKIPATMADPAKLVVTATCEQGAGQVRVFVRETTTTVSTKVFTSGGCGATAATTGKTVTVPMPTTLAAGTYEVLLKQGSGTSAVISAPFGPITLP